MGKRATLRDVAQASGVSVSTVSFVLNRAKDQTIPQVTQDRVRRAAKKLNYRPHSIAKTLREGSSKTVILNTGQQTTGHSLSSFIDGLDAELRAHGFTLLVVHNYAPGKIPQPLIDAIAPHKIIDLAALYGAQTSENPAWEGGWEQGLAAHSAVQVSYLASKGHTQIAFALPPPGPLERFERSRVSYFLQAAENANLAAPQHFRVGHSRLETAAVLRSLRTAYPQVTAIAGLDDFSALAVLGALSELGLRAPADYAVIGFDHSALAQLGNPTLTTVAIDARAHGMRLARQAIGVAPQYTDPSPAQIVPGESA